MSAWGLASLGQSTAAGDVAFLSGVAGAAAVRVGSEAACPPTWLAACEQTPAHAGAALPRCQKVQPPTCIADARLRSLLTGTFETPLVRRPLERHPGHLSACTAPRLMRSVQLGGPPGGDWVAREICCPAGVVTWLLVQTWLSSPLSLGPI